MKSYCTRSVLYLSLVLLVVGAAACTQSKPQVPTPTLVPLANETIIAPAANGTLVPAGSTPLAPIDNATLIPPLGNETPVAPEAQTPVGEPTLIATPTTVGDTGQTVIATPVPDNTTASGTCTNPYTVQPGEWFYAVARKCGVSPQDLLAANPSLNANVLRPGQVLNMPAGSSNANPPPATASSGSNPPPASGSCSNPYTVQRGDTLFSIARRCGSTVAAIQSANNLPSPEYIFPGQQLRIP